MKRRLDENIMRLENRAIRMMYSLTLILSVMMATTYLVNAQNTPLIVPDYLEPSCTLSLGDTLFLNATHSTFSKDSTVYILADEDGKIVEINTLPELHPSSEVHYLSYALTFKKSAIVDSLSVGSNLNDISVNDESCLSWSDPLTIGVCPEEGVDCHFYVNQDIDFSLNGGNYDPLFDSITYILAQANSNIVSISNSSSYPSLNNDGRYFAYTLTTDKSSSTISNLTVNGNLSDVVVDGCFDWTGPTIIDVCPCVTDSVFITEQICHDETYQFGSQSLSMWGTYEETFTNAGGCDSVVTLQLMIMGRDTIHLFDRICAGDSALFNNIYYKNQGVYSNTGIDIYGCNETQVFHLTVLQNLPVIPPTSYDSCTVEIGEIINTSLSGGNVVSPDTTVIILTTATGEIVNINNTGMYVIDSIGQYQIYTLSYGEIKKLEGLVVGGNINTMSICGCADLSQGIGIEVCQTCDSIYNTVLPDLIGCQGIGVIYKGVTYTQDTVFQDSLVTADGCDSIVTQNIIFEENQLTLGRPLSYDSCAVSQDSLFYLTPTGGNLSSTDSTLYIITDDNGVIVNFSFDNSFILSDTGQYEAYTLSYDGSEIPTGLNIGSNINNIISCDCAQLSNGIGFEVCQSCVEIITNLIDSTCFGDLYTFADIVITTTGIYRDTILTLEGCDSIVVLDFKVNVLPVISASNDTTICIGSGVALNATGGITYKWVPSLDLSADSIANPIASPSFTRVYTVIVTDENGCSATDQVLIIVNDSNDPGQEVNIDTTICFIDTYNLNGTILSSEGVYRDTLLTAGGCDSIIVLNLMVSGGLINPQIATLFDSCITDPQTSVDLSSKVGQVTPLDTVVYLLADSIGVVLSIKNYPGYLGLNVGKYSLFVISYYTSTPLIVPVVGQNISTLSSCGEVNISEPYGFEVCDLCPLILASIPTDFGDCAVTVDDTINITYSAGQLSSNDTTLYIITDNNGIIQRINRDTLLVFTDTGRYVAYTISYPKNGPPSGLVIGSSIQNISSCECTDISDGVGFEVCPLREYDLSFKVLFSKVLLLITYTMTFLLL